MRSEVAFLCAPRAEKLILNYPIDIGSDYIILSTEEFLVQKLTILHVHSPIKRLPELFCKF